MAIKGEGPLLRKTGISLSDKILIFLRASPLTGTLPYIFPVAVFLISKPIDSALYPVPAPPGNTRHSGPLLPLCTSLIPKPEQPPEPSALPPVPYARLAWHKPLIPETSKPVNSLTYVCPPFSREKYITCGIIALAVMRCKNQRPGIDSLGP